MIRHPGIDPVFLSIGPLQFRWYGLMYLLAFLTSYAVIRYVSRKREPFLSPDEVGDLVFYVAVGIVLGGRLGYVIFYNLPVYLAHPLKILAVWEGGMSFHGGLLGGIVGGYLFSRKKGIDPLLLADTAFLPAPLGLMYGRIGNFINGELYGRVTDLPWGMVFPAGGEVPRHPSQLYEAVLEGPLLFLLLLVVHRSTRYRRGLIWAFIGGYGVARFLVEFVREPDAQLGFVVGWLSMGQILSLPMIAIGVTLFVLQVRRNRSPVTGGSSS